MGEGGDTSGRCMTQLLRSDFLVDDGKTPRSIEISRPENRIMRIPDTHMMMKQQMGLHDMLQGIFKVRFESGQGGAASWPGHSPLLPLARPQDSLTWP